MSVPIMSRDGVRAGLARLDGSPVPAVVVALALNVVLVVVLAPDGFAAAAQLAGGLEPGAGLATTLARTIPLSGLALAVFVPLRAGVFNLGVEGQLLIGTLAGTAAALHAPGPALVAIPFSLLVAAAAGAAWASIPALLAGRRLGLPVFLTSLLLNYVASGLSSDLLRAVLKDPGTSNIATRQVPEQLRLPALAAPGSWADRQVIALFGDLSPLRDIGRQVNVSVVVLVAMFLVVAWVCRRTTLGFEWTLMGRNTSFASYAGVDTARRTWDAMAVSGAISGVIGTMLVLGTTGRLYDGDLEQTNYAWTALLAALTAGLSITGVVVMAFLYAALLVGAETLQRETGLSSQIALIMQATVIVLVSMRIGLGVRRRRGPPPTPEPPEPPETQSASSGLREPDDDRTSSRA